MKKIAFRFLKKVQPTPQEVTPRRPSAEKVQSVYPPQPKPTRAQLLGQKVGKIRRNVRAEVARERYGRQNREHERILSGEPEPFIDRLYGPNIIDRVLSWTNPKAVKNTVKNGWMTDKEFESLKGVVREGVFRKK